MGQIIKDKQLQESDFTVLAEEGDLTQANIIVPLSRYVENQATLTSRSDVGLLVEPDDDVEAVAELIKDLSLVALNFPSYLDGRAYSTANMIRREFEYTGELRAVGDVRRDQLEQMARCGFDAFAMAEGQDVQASLDGLKNFSYNYQTSIDRPEPLFRNR